MEDGDTEKYHASRVIQDFVFSSRKGCCISVFICKYIINTKYQGSSTPASNLGYLASPPGQFFMGAKLFIGTPWMGNEGVLKKILVWAM